MRLASLLAGRGPLELREGQAFTLLLGIAFAACHGESQAETQEVSRAEEARTREFVYDVDLERVRALGWSRQDSGDEEVVEAAVATLKRRLPLGKRVLAEMDDAELNIRVQLDERSPLTSIEAERVTAAIESLGLFEMPIVADERQLAELGIDPEEEQRKLEDWREAHPRAPLGIFNLVPAVDGGPDEHIYWLLTRCLAGASEPAPVLVPMNFQSVFCAAALEKVYVLDDYRESPAVGFDLEASYRDSFGDFTELNEGRWMAIVVHDMIVPAPSIDERLPGGGIIRVEDQDDMKALVSDFRKGTGPLRRPALVARPRVSASGSDHSVHK